MIGVSREYRMCDNYYVLYVTTTWLGELLISILTRSQMTNYHCLVPQLDTLQSAELNWIKHQTKPNFCAFDLMHKALAAQY